VLSILIPITLTIIVSIALTSTMALLVLFLLLVYFCSLIIIILITHTPRARAHTHTTPHHTNTDDTQEELYNAVSNAGDLWGKKPYNGHVRFYLLLCSIYIIFWRSVGQKTCNDNVHM
jgi:hypothetical protein